VGERPERRALDRGLIAAMRIRLNNPALTGDLVDYLRQNDCEAMAMGPNLVAVSLSHALPYDAARLELGVHLGDWALENGNSAVVILD
jgi:hypothetical protein